MMNSLLLMNDVPALVQFGVLLGIALVAGLLLFRQRTATRLQMAEDSAGNLTMSAFSRLPPATAQFSGEDVDLLTEAEIYVLYGRKNEAQKVLDVGLRQGRISTEQVIGFWSRPRVSRRL
ncbi:MAG: hypothetical protein ACM3X0_16435 [Bacteroidota bacterium]